MKVHQEVHALTVTFFSLRNTVIVLFIHALSLMFFSSRNIVIFLTKSMLVQ